MKTLFSPEGEDPNSDGQIADVNSSEQGASYITGTLHCTPDPHRAIVGNFLTEHGKDFLKQFGLESYDGTAHLQFCGLQSHPWHMPCSVA
jgi:hypothetical protein